MKNGLFITFVLLAAPLAQAGILSDGWFGDFSLVASQGNALECEPKLHTVREDQFPNRLLLPEIKYNLDGYGPLGFGPINEGSSYYCEETFVCYENRVRYKIKQETELLISEEKKCGASLFKGCPFSAYKPIFSATLNGSALKVEAYKDKKSIASCEYKKD